MGEARNVCVNPWNMEYPYGIWILMVTLGSKYLNNQHIPVIIISMLYIWSMMAQNF